MTDLRELLRSLRKDIAEAARAGGSQGAGVEGCSRQDQTRFWLNQSYSSN